MRNLLAVAAIVCVPACTPRARSAEEEDSPKLACPEGTRQMSTTSTGLPRYAEACHLPDGTLHGPAIEWWWGTKLFGRYDHGRRVGHWAQHDEGSGAKIGGFTLDDEGTGEYVTRWPNGQVAERGRLVRGRLDGFWSVTTSAGALMWSAEFRDGKAVHESGVHPGSDPVPDAQSLCEESVPDGCPDLPEDPAEACALLPKMRSHGAYHATAVLFANATGEEIVIAWIGYDGKLQPMARVAPGAKHAQASYFSHGWAALDPRGRCLAVVEAEDDLGEVTIRRRAR